MSYIDREEGRANCMLQRMAQYNAEGHLDVARKETILTTLQVAMTVSMVAMIVITAQFEDLDYLKWVFLGGSFVVAIPMYFLQNSVVQQKARYQFATHFYSQRGPNLKPYATFGDIPLTDPHLFESRLKDKHINQHPGSWDVENGLHYQQDLANSEGLLRIRRVRNHLRMNNDPWMAIQAVVAAANHAKINGDLAQFSELMKKAYEIARMPEMDERDDLLHVLKTDVLFNLFSFEKVLAFDRDRLLKIAKVAPKNSQEVEQLLNAYRAIIAIYDRDSASIRAEELANNVRAQTDVTIEERNRVIAEAKDRLYLNYLLAMRELQEPLKNIEKALKITPFGQASCVQMILSEVELLEGDRESAALLDFCNKYIQREKVVVLAFDEARFLAIAKATPEPNQDVRGLIDTYRGVVASYGRDHDFSRYVQAMRELEEPLESIEKAHNIDPRKQTDFENESIRISNHLQAVFGEKGREAVLDIDNTRLHSIYARFSADEGNAPREVQQLMDAYSTILAAYHRDSNLYKYMVAMRDLYEPIMRFEEALHIAPFGQSLCNRIECLEKGIIRIDRQLVADLDRRVMRELDGEGIVKAYQKLLYSYDNHHHHFPTHFKGSVDIVFDIMKLQEALQLEMRWPRKRFDLLLTPLLSQINQKLNLKKNEELEAHLDHGDYRALLGDLAFLAKSERDLGEAKNKIAFLRKEIAHQQACIKNALLLNHKPRQWEELRSMFEQSGTIGQEQIEQIKKVLAEDICPPLWRIKNILRHPPQFLETVDNLCTPLPDLTLTALSDQQAEEELKHLRELSLQLSAISSHDQFLSELEQMDEKFNALSKICHDSAMVQKCEGSCQQIQAQEKNFFSLTADQQSVLVQLTQRVNLELDARIMSLKRAQALSSQGRSEALNALVDKIKTSRQTLFEAHLRCLIALHCNKAPDFSDLHLGKNEQIRCHAFEIYFKNLPSLKTAEEVAKSGEEMKKIADKLKERLSLYLPFDALIRESEAILADNTLSEKDKNMRLIAFTEKVHQFQVEVETLSFSEKFAIFRSGHPPLLKFDFERASSQQMPALSQDQCRQVTAAILAEMPENYRNDTAVVEAVGTRITGLFESNAPGLLAERIQTLNALIDTINTLRRALNEAHSRCLKTLRDNTAPDFSDLPLMTTLCRSFELYSKNPSDSRGEMQAIADSLKVMLNNYSSLKALFQKGQSIIDNKALNDNEKCEQLLSLTKEVRERLEDIEDEGGKRARLATRVAIGALQKQLRLRDNQFKKVFDKALIVDITQTLTFLAMMVAAIFWLVASANMWIPLASMAISFGMRKLASHFEEKQETIHNKEILPLRLYLDSVRRGKPIRIAKTLEEASHHERLLGIYGLDRGLSTARMVDRAVM